MDKIYVAGHTGMFGSAILRQLKKEKKKKIILATKNQLDLEDQNQVYKFFKIKKPDIVILAAAKVGGILANIKQPADFIAKNIQIQNNVFNASKKFNVKKLIFLGSSCMYPKNLSKKIKESFLLSGYPEDTNRAYAVAKISGVVMCEAFNEQYFNGRKKFRCIVPPNLFGPGDNYDENNSHVVASLIKKFYEAKKNKKKTVEIWGSGKPKREFMHVDDAANAVIKILKLSDKKFENLVGKNSHINISYGKDYTIKELATILKKISKFNGSLYFNQKMPDGVKRKLMSNELSKKLGFFKNYNLYDKLEETFKNYK